MTTPQHSRLIILGSGPAGYTAAVYAARANLKPTLITGLEVGGQLTTTAAVDNWPGDDAGVQGPELVARMKRHAERFETKMVYDTIHKVDITQRPFVLEGINGTYTCDALILATGATARYLGLPSEKAYIHRGVSTCAPCEGVLYRGKKVAVVGGGNTGVEYAIDLSHIADRVSLVVRGDELTSEHILRGQLQERVQAGKVDILWNSEVDEITGDSDGVTGLRTRSTVDGTNRVNHELDVAGVFIAIGTRPNTELFEGQLETQWGYLKVNGGTDGMATATSVPGVFAAGDVADSNYRQAITSSAFGCMAALDADRWLSENAPG